MTFFLPYLSLFYKDLFSEIDLLFYREPDYFNHTEKT